MEALAEKVSGVVGAYDPRDPLYVLARSLVSPKYRNSPEKINKFRCILAVYQDATDGDGEKSLGLAKRILNEKYGVVAAPPLIWSLWKQANYEFSSKKDSKPEAAKQYSPKSRELADRLAELYPKNSDVESLSRKFGIDVKKTVALLGIKGIVAETNFGYRKRKRERCIQIYSEVKGDRSKAYKKLSSEFPDISGVYIDRCWKRDVPTAR
jgi:hypothetical protein